MVTLIVLVAAGAAAYLYRAKIVAVVQKFAAKRNP